MSKSKNVERRKELTAVQHLKNWYHANEKLFWVVFLVFIAFSFGFTMAPQQLMEGFGGGVVIGKVFDEEVTREEFKIAGEELGSAARFVGVPFGEGGYSQWDYIVFQKEAARLDLVVSDEELGERVRNLYWGMKAMEGLDPSNSRSFQSEVQSEVERLREANQFNPKEYATLLKERFRIGNHQFFERALRNLIRVEKLKRYVEGSPAVAPEDVIDIYLRQDQFRKFSFFQIELDEARQGEIGAAFSEDDLREYYDENSQRFRFYTPEIKLDYVFIPGEYFEETVEVTDKEIQEKYEKIKNPRYKRTLDVDVGSSFELLSEDEQASQEDALFRPLAEVREEVVEELKADKSRTETAKLGRDLGKKLVPNKKGAVGVGAESEDPEVPSLEEIQKEYPFVEVGTTSWINSGNSREELGDYYSRRVQTMLTTATQNRSKSPEERKEITLFSNAVETQDKKGSVLYSAVKVRYPNETEFEDHLEDAREKLSLVKLMDEIEETADPLIRQVRDGEFDLAAAAEKLDGEKVHTTAFLGQADRINVPVEEEDEAEEGEKKDAKESSDSEEEDAPKTEPLKGDYVVKRQGFAIATVGDCKLARDEFNGQLFLVRFDDKSDPDVKELTDQRKSQILNSLRFDHRRDIFVKWHKDLWARARPSLAVYREPSSSLDEGAGAEGSQSAPEANAAQ